jgi:pyruvate/2-oxoglutarate dehydrogenase complex dihydrolipoamide acyltransferase (E2) component
MKPVWDGKQFVPRLMLPLSLSYDHRVIDGAAAALSTPTWANCWRTSAASCCERTTWQ